jgi:hypothetical protein
MEHEDTQFCCTVSKVHSLCTDIDTHHAVSCCAVLCHAVLCRAVLRARRAAVRVKEREAAQQLLQAHDPVKAAATRHGWLMFTVPEKPVAGRVMWVLRDKFVCLKGGGGVVPAATLNLVAWGL